MMAGGRTTAERHGWKLAIQSWTFHSIPLVQAIDSTAALGVKYIEVYPSHRIGGQAGDKGFDYTLDDATLSWILSYAKSRGVRIVGSGVFTTDKREEWLREFSFAKRAHLEYITAEPRMQDWPLVDSLVRKTGIRISVHNHPKPSEYWSPQHLLDAISTRSPRIGSCADVGHWRRCGLDPVECMKVMGKRIISLHFKDIVAGDNPEAMHDTVWGTGILDLRGMLSYLKSIRFKGYFAIEYEYDWDHSMPLMARSIRYFNSLADELY